jgi:hypothetical protein
LNRTFEQVLPLELAIYLGLRELDAAASVPNVFCFGRPCTHGLLERIGAMRNRSIWGRGLTGAEVSSLAERIGPNDLVLLFPEGPVPAEAQRLCGEGWTGLEPKLSADAGFEQVVSPLAHVTVAWGPDGLQRVGVMLGLDGGL